MKIEIVYIYPVDCGYDQFVTRFLGSYMENPPAIDHKTTIVCNRAMPNKDQQAMFSFMPHLNFLQHDNSGYDLGGFQFASSISDSDLIVFFGTSTYFKGQGWLLRMASSYLKHGVAQYGCMGNRGEPICGVKPHIRTTAFWMPPSLFNRYPIKVTRPEQRHPVEHFEGCITDWVTSQGLKNWIVSWTDEYLWADWDNIPDGFHRGNQSALLAGDRISEPPYHHCQ